MQRTPSQKKANFDMWKDNITTNIVYTAVNVVKWYYHTIFKRDIHRYNFGQKSVIKNSESSLYLHGKFQFLPNENVTAIVLLHGTRGHPFTLLDLANTALKANVGPVFNVHFNYNEEKPKMHRDLLKQSLDFIENKIKNRGGIFQGFILVGHSLGAIESAYMAYVVKDSRIKAVISIAGRLRYIDSEDKPCNPFVKPIIEAVYKGILENPEPPLYQIIAGNDWNAPLEATLVRPTKDHFYIIENAMHFNILYFHETGVRLTEFLKIGS